MQGKIIKGIAGFYYVHVVEFGVYECKAKGVFRKEKIKPLVGDNVEIEVLDESEKKGNIVKILPRQNELIRPAVANIDQALVVFATWARIPILIIFSGIRQKQSRRASCIHEAAALMLEIHEQSNMAVCAAASPAAS